MSHRFLTAVLLVLLFATSQADAIGTSLTCRDEFGLGASVLGGAVGRAGICLDFDFEDGKCEDKSEILISEFVSMIPSKIDEQHCDYLGKKLSFIHLGNDQYELRYDDGPLVGQKIVSCRLPQPCR